MTAELQKNALEAYRKLTTFACAENQLDGIGAALVSARDTGAAVPTMAPYQRPLTPFSDDAWRAATAAGVANHIPKDRLLAYSRAYFFADDQRERIMPWEQEAMDRLNTLTINGGRLQPDERDRLFASIVFARRVLLQGSLSAANYLEDARELGVNISPKEKAEAQATERSYMGQCVGDAMTRGQILAMYRRDWGRGTLSAPLK